MQQRNYVMIKHRTLRYRLMGLSFIHLSQAIMMVSKRSALTCR